MARRGKVKEALEEFIEAYVINNNVVVQSLSDEAAAHMAKKRLKKIKPEHVISAINDNIFLSPLYAKNQYVSSEFDQPLDSDFTNRISKHAEDKLNELQKEFKKLDFDDLIYENNDKTNKMFILKGKLDWVTELLETSVFLPFPFQDYITKIHHYLTTEQMGNILGAKSATDLKQLKLKFYNTKSFILLTKQSYNDVRNYFLNKIKEKPQGKIIDIEHYQDDLNEIAERLLHRGIKDADVDDFLARRDKTQRAAIKKEHQRAKEQAHCYVLLQEPEWQERFKRNPVSASKAIKTAVKNWMKRSRAKKIRLSL